MKSRIRRVVFAPWCYVAGHIEHVSIVQRFEGNRGVQVNVYGCLRCDKVLREQHLHARHKVRA